MPLSFQLSPALAMRPLPLLSLETNSTDSTSSIYSPITTLTQVYTLDGATLIPTQMSTYYATNIISPTTSISVNEVVGIGVGAAVAGGLLTLLAVCIFMKRFKRSGPGGGRRHCRRESDLEKTIGGRNEITLEQNLLERADDSHIRKSMQDLNELINQHCENHYHLHTFEPSQNTLERPLIACGYGNNPSVQEMVTLLVDPRSRFAAVRQLIATIITSNIDWKTRPEISLLPTQITTFCNTIPPVEKQPGCQEGESICDPPELCN